MDYQTAKAYQQQLEQVEKAASDKLNAINGIGTGPLGLTPDSVKSTPEYQQASKEYSAAFQALRNFNGWFTKQFKKEYAADRKARRAQVTF